MGGRVFLTGHGHRAQPGASGCRSRAGAGRLRRVARRGAGHPLAPLSRARGPTSVRSPCGPCRTALRHQPPALLSAPHGWTRAFGTTDLDLRLFSVVCSLAAFPLLYLLGRRLSGRRAALVAVLLYSIAPISLYYSVEGRMYSLLWFLGLAAAWLSLRLHDRGPRPVSMLLLTLTGAAGLLASLLLRLRLGCLPGVALAVSRPNLACLAGRDRGAHGTPGTAMVPASSGKSRSVADHRSLAGGRPVPGAGGHRPAHPRVESFSVRGPWGRNVWVDRVGIGSYFILILAVGRKSPRALLSREQPAGLALAAVRVRRPAHLRSAAGYPCLADIPLRSPSRARGNALGRDGPESPRSAAQHDLPGLGRGRVAARHSSGLP